MNPDRTIPWDWYPGRVPENVTVHESAYLETTYSFELFQSRHAHAIEIGLPDALPFAIRFRAQPLAGGQCGRNADGGGARTLLSGMLLVFDGALVRGRDHEPRVDGRDHRLRLCRKTVPGGTVDSARRRNCDAGVRNLPSVSGLTSLLCRA